MSVNFSNFAFVQARFKEGFKNPKPINKEDLDSTPNPAIEDTSSKTPSNGGLNLNSPDKKIDEPGYGGIA